MTSDRFARRYRVVVLAAAASWRAWLIVACGGISPGSLVFGVGLGLLPFAALAALAAWIRGRWVLVVAACATLALDVYAAIPAIEGQSSTAGVAIMLAPLISLITIVPLAALLDGVLNQRA